MPILKEAHLREEKIESPNHYQPIYLVLQFLSTTSLLPKSKDGGNQFTWWNQPTCGSFQDPFGKKYYSFFLHYLRGDQETKKEAALAAAVIHSEYYKSRVSSSTDENTRWKSSLS